MKKLVLQQRGETPHWVGDGFPVSSIFRYDNLGKMMSPFLLMDYAGPTSFPASPNHRRGVGEHPHRGFETVTIVYDGQVEHRDSAGGGGVIQKGDVQWMTAASGLVHEEFHGRDFSEKGGAFEMVQLWVNLPSKYKMTSPRYQGIKNSDIPTVTLADNKGEIRVIAGDAQMPQSSGPAKTFSPINLWDMRLKADQDITLNLPEGHTTTLFVLSGGLTTSDVYSLGDSELGIFERDGTELKFRTTKDSKILLMGGEPINEPIIGWGPFVMNTQKEIAEALKDYQEGRMGTLQKIEGAE